MKKLFNRYSRDLIECGLDEVGRGCIAGPVVAAAVILPKAYNNEQIRDSKQLSQLVREKLFEEIYEKALSVAVAEVSPQEIDRINILNASFLAMNLAREKLTVQPELLLVDGNRFKSNTDQIPFKTMVKGDNSYLSIAAASIIAKVYRDRLMVLEQKGLPDYGWESNKGYPTAAHLKALNTFGVTQLHRKTFGPVSKVLTLGCVGDLS